MTEDTMLSAPGAHRGGELVLGNSMAGHNHRHITGVSFKLDCPRCSPAAYPNHAKHRADDEPPGWEDWD